MKKILVIATAMLMSACGGGADSGIVTLQSPAANLAAGAAADAAAIQAATPPLLTGPNTGAMQVRVTSLDDNQPVAGVIVMIDDGGATQTTNIAGYVSFTGLTAGAHNVFAFPTVGGAVLFSGLYVVDLAHVEMKMQRTATVVSSSLKIAGAFANSNKVTGTDNLHGYIKATNGYSAEAFEATSGGITQTFATGAGATTGTYSMLVSSRGFPVSTAFTADVNFRKTGATVNGLTTLDVAGAANMPLTSQDGLFVVITNPFDMNFSITPPTPNMTLLGTATQPAGIFVSTSVDVFPSPESALSGVNVFSARFTDRTLPLDYYTVASDHNIALLKGSTLNGAGFFQVPGAKWERYVEVAANGAFAHNTGFTTACDALDNQTGLTFAFTPATGTAAYHQLQLGTSASAIWLVDAPATAISVTLPTTVPVGALNPYPAAGVAYSSTASLTCFARSNQTYQSFAEGVKPSNAGFSFEKYEKQVTYKPF